jgi:ribosomal protein S26
VTSYLACRNCGRYVPAASAVNRAYCSEECTRAYSECANCGTVFPRGKGFDGEYCTRECTTRYQILRKYGPEPVTVVTEV